MSPGHDATRASGAGLTHRRRVATTRQEPSEAILPGAAGAINQRVMQSFYRATLLGGDGTDGVQSPACADLESAFEWARRFVRIARAAGDPGASAAVEEVRVRRLGVLD